MPRLRLLPPVEAAETPEEAAPIFDYLMNRGGAIAIDTETTGLDIMRERVLFWSMATEDRRFFFSHDLLGYFDPLFTRPDLTWILANAKFDMHMMRNMGYGLAGPVMDIIDMDAMDDDTRPHGLKDQSWFAYEARWGDFKELFLDPHMVGTELGLDRRTYQEFKTWNVGEKLLFVHNERPDLVENYASCDAYFTYFRGMDLIRTLSASLLPTQMVDGMTSAFDYYRTIEMPLTKELWEMERAGFAIDMDWVKKIDLPMREGIKSAEDKMRDIVGFDFNAKANEQIQKILYGADHFGIKPLSFTTGGKGGKAVKEPKPKVDEKTLSKLKLRFDTSSPEYRFIDAKLAHAKLVKLHGTYVKKINQITGPDGRIHTKIRQMGARTSRMSSADPNLQNIPIRNDPYQIRGMFVADPGTDLIDFDYPQIEFRIAAALAGEEGMMEAIRKGWDIHSANAAAMYRSDPKVSYDAIMAAKHRKDTKSPDFGDLDKYLLKKRDGAKTTGLGALYGEGDAKMAQDLGISKEEARELRETFFNTNTCIAAQIRFMHQFAHNHEFTHTMLGRCRRLHRINNEYSSGLAAAEERQAYNTLIQGSGAEMMKLAILRVGANKDFRALGGRLILTIHDELIARAPKDTSKEVYGIMKACMADPFNYGPIKLDYPVPVDPDGAIGYRWSDVK